METQSSQIRTGFITRFVRWLFCWRTARRILVSLAVLATLLAIFYAEENWRGRRAWEQCKREMEAQGVVLDWSAYIPPPVPDGQNVFKAPKMAEWFVGRGSNELSGRLTNSATRTVGTTNNAVVTATEAHEYLKWSDQLTNEFNLIREALKRPYARIDTDYKRPFEMAIPNFVTMRGAAQTLAQRTHCYLLLGRPEDALEELKLLHDLCRPLEGRPTGQPMTLVAAMINVAIKGLYANTIADGFRLNSWREPQLAAIQEQLRQVNLLPLLASSLESEPPAVCQMLENTPPKQLAKLMGSTGPSSMRILLRSMPRGWIYQNMVVVARRSQHYQDGLDLANQRILPHQMGEAIREMEKSRNDWSPFEMIGYITTPNFIKAWQTTARNQTLVNQGAIACALERYRLATGQYPETLDALVPKFIEKLPHDIIGGQPMKYRRTADGQFLLYSIGWNEKDDDGQIVRNKDGAVDVSSTEGDWVWPVPTK